MYPKLLSHRKIVVRFLVIRPLLFHTVWLQAYQKPNKVPLLLDPGCKLFSPPYCPHWEWELTVITHCPDSKCSNFQSMTWWPSFPGLTLWCPLLPYGYSFKASSARPGKAVICNFWHPGTLTLSHERQSARMSKITNDGLTRSGTGCSIAVSIWKQWASTG